MVSLNTMSWRASVGTVCSRKLLDNLFSLVVIHTALAGIGFVTRVGMANAIGIDQFGDLAFALAIGAYGQMFVEFGLEKTFVRDLVHFPNRLGEFVKASLCLRFGMFAILAILLTLSTPFLPPSVSDSWELLPALIATVLLAFQLQGVYDAWKEMRRHSIFALVERCLYFASVWLAILTPWFTLSLFRIGLLMLASVSIGLFLQYRWAWRRTDFTPVFGVWKTTVSMSQSNVWIWLASLSGLSIGFLNQIVLRCYAGSAELGKFSAAWLLISVAILVLNQVARVGSEAAARYTRTGTAASEQLRFLTKYVILMAAVGFAMGLPFVLFSGRILTVFRQEYATAAIELRILGLYPMFYAPFLATLQYVISSRLQKTYFALITIVGVNGLVLCLWLIPYMRGIGAAIAVVVSIGIATAIFLTAAGLHLRGLGHAQARYANVKTTA